MISSIDRLVDITYKGDISNGSKQMTLEQTILAAAARRDVSAKLEASLNNVTIDAARKAIRKLVREHKLYANSKSRPGYWGSAETGYRAV